MGAGRQMTPEEEEALRQYVLAQQAQMNPFAYSANDWGQGPGALMLDEQPETWDRVGEINDLIYDTTRTTGDSFRSLVPVPYKDVEQPDPKAPYQSDTSFLYSSNPVYQAIGQLVSGAGGESPMSLDQALLKFQAEYEANPEEFAGMVPVTTGYNQSTGTPAGALDMSQIRQGAETYLTETRKEQNSAGANDLAQQEWEDYIRPRSQYEVSGSPVFSDVRDQYAKQYGWDDPRLGFEELNPGTVQATAPRVPMDLAVENGGGRVVPGMMLSDTNPLIQPAGDTRLTPDRITSLTRNPLAGAKRQQRGDQARADAEAVRNSPNRPMVGYIQHRGENQGIGRGVVERDGGEMLFKATYDAAMEKAKNRQMASKKETNEAARLAALRSIYYGQA